MVNLRSGLHSNHKNVDSSTTQLLSLTTWFYTHTHTHTHTIFKNALISSKSNGKTSITFPLSHKPCHNNESWDYISVCRFFNIFPAEKFASDGQLISSFHFVIIYLYFFLWRLIFKLSLSVELMLCPHIVFVSDFSSLWFLV